LLVALFRDPLLSLLGPRVNLPADLLLAISVFGLILLLNVPARRLALHVRMTPIGRWDPLLGVGLQVATASLVAYLVVGTLADAEAAVRPLLRDVGTVSVRQVNAFATASQRNPLLLALTTSADLSHDRAAAAGHALTLPRLEERHPWLRWYLEEIRPALLTSRLAPVVIRYGDRIPWVGRPDRGLS
jgi:hypothetical protein